MLKVRNFDSFGDVFPHFCPDNREIWHGQRVAPAERKTHFWTTE